MATHLESLLEDPERLATLGFLSLRGVGAGTCERLCKAFGSLAEALAADPERYLPVLSSGARDDHAAGGSLQARAEQVVRRCQALGAWIAFRGDPGWPAPLADLGRTEPRVLFVRGALSPDRPADHWAAVVGTRHPDSRGVFVAEHLGATLAGAGVGVVSGGAEGIDAAAHRGALSAAGVTWAVLGAGFDHLFPKSNVALFDRIAAHGGAVITECPPAHEVRAGSFPRRNRIVAALGRIAVVVQGRVDSGGLLTARDALKLGGRALLAVPGDLRDPLADGPHMLLREGVARACCHSSDALVALGLQAALTVVPREGVAPAWEPLPPAPIAPARRVVLDAALEPVYQALTAAPQHVEAIASAVSLPTPQLLAALTQLELLGVCEQRPGKLFVRRSG